MLHAIYYFIANKVFAHVLKAVKISKSNNSTFLSVDCNNYIYVNKHRRYLTIVLIHCLFAYLRD